MNRRIRGLYAITGETSDTPLLVAQVCAALRGGARIVQYRNKAGAQRLRLEQASALAARVRAAGAVFIVNDSVELAERAGADGVHLGRDDDAIQVARERLGRAALVGVSCYDQLERARVAEQAGADYVAFGSFYASRTKPGAVRAPLALLRDAKAALRIPLVAIGGIDATNCLPLIAAGADAVAVASAVFDADDVEAAAAALATQFDSRATSAIQTATR